MKRIHLIYAGGTIGMRATPAGLAPAADLFERLHGDAGAPLARLERELGCRFGFERIEPLIDSAEVDPGTWRALARAVRARGGEADAFVLLHGTDTLAYSGAALSFRCAGLGRPLVLTGSMRPLGHAGSDALHNVALAVRAALQAPAPEVMIAFGRHVLRANRATKVSAEAFDAFRSPNHPPLARVLDDGTLAWSTAGAGAAAVASTSFPDGIADETEKADAADTAPWPSIAVLHLHPGIDIARWRAVLEADPPSALVLRSYGSGNAPVASTPLVALLADLSALGTLVVNLSACGHGAVRAAAYAAGRPLDDAGVLPGGDLTLECAVAKLDWVCSRHAKPVDRRRAFAQVAHGEATPA
jgi:L-asparaginase/Glu-tRNA(Gln) amidotransferase subunit D